MGQSGRKNLAVHVRGVGSPRPESISERQPFAADIRADFRGETETEAEVTNAELLELARLATRLEQLGARYAVFLSVEDRRQLRRAVELARKAIHLLSSQGTHLLGSG